MAWLKVSDRPHRFPPMPEDGYPEIIAWECQACGKLISEYRYDERGECPVDWRRKGADRNYMNALATEGGGCDPLVLRG